MKPIKIHSSGLTDTGLVRDENQDNIFVSPEMGLYLVLDGMGGHKGGATASRIACEVMVDVVGGGLRHKNHKRLIVNACKAGGAKVHQEANRNRELHGMGTTVVAMVMPRPDLAIIAHVGDSRAYLMRDKRLKRLTTDHTVVAELVALGKLSPDEAINHPHASVLSRNLGGLPITDVEVAEFELKRGDRLLLCSDGLNGYASRGAIEQVLGGAASASAATQDLIELAKRGGGGDNISAIVVDIGEQNVRSVRQDIVQESGAKAWWQRRALFVDVCTRMGIADSSLAAGMPTADAIDILAGSFCEAVYHDLESTTGVHVWTYADSLVKGWFARDGAYRPIQELFDILRAGSLAVVQDVSTTDENFGVCLEIALLRALIVGEMVVGGQLGSRIQSANEQFVAQEKTSELPEATFASVATIPFASIHPAMPTAPDVSRCLGEAAQVARQQVRAERYPLLEEILAATHAAADEFSGDGDMTTAATDLYGNHLLAEQEITPILEALDTCRHAHLAAIDMQHIQPAARATAYRAAALAHQSLYHAFAMVTVDAGKPTTDKLREMSETTANMRQRLARNEQRLDQLEATIDTVEEMRP